VNKKLFFLLLLMPVAVFAQSTGGDPLTATLSSLYRILVGAAGIIASIFIIWSILSAGLNLMRGLSAVGVALIAAWVVTHTDRIVAFISSI
jgi:hypothetical protein